MSLHRVDPRFVLPHRVNRAVVLGGLHDWETGLSSAGIEIVDAAADKADLVVAPAGLAAVAQATHARAIMIEGSRERALKSSEYRAWRLLLRPTRQRPTLALPLDQAAAAAYALEHWSVVDRRWKHARVRAARTLVSRGRFPSWGSPIVTVATRDADTPFVVSAARDFGVPREVGWFLTFGQGDALSRNAFQLFLPGRSRPEWVLKFARIAGYSERFDNDEAGLRLAQQAGGVVATHAPRLVGRFEVDGLHASLETFAAGRRLRDVLITPGDRPRKLRLIEQIAAWILELGRSTRSSPETMTRELHRLRTEVVPSWTDLGAGLDLVDELQGVPAVTQHNDLGAWNVVARDGDFVVLDWENVRRDALPLWDLVYFLGNALVLVDGAYTADELPGRMARLFAGETAVSPLLFAWVRRGAEAAAVPAEAVAAVTTLCWLSHSLSAREHNVDIAAFTPRDPPRLHGLEGIAHVWMSHPGLGSSWSAWQQQ